MSYRLVTHVGSTYRSHWWKDLDKPKHGEPSWWIEGKSSITGELVVNRPATDTELSIYQDCLERAIRAVHPFSAYVNVTEAGGTPEDALRKEFGIE